MLHRENASDEVADEEDGAPESVGRRSLLRLGGIAVAGAAAAAAASAVSADPAGAADGDSLVLGTNGPPNQSTQPTGLYYDSGPNFQQGYFGLGVIDHSTTNGVFDGTPAVGGVANNANFRSGVQGIGTNNANGVVGKTDGAIGTLGQATGTGTGAIGQNLNTAANPLEALGVQGVVLSDGYGVAGSALSGAGTEGAGVFGLHTGSGAGVRGIDNGIGQGIAVEGLLTNASNPSAALHGSTMGTGPALLAEQQNAGATAPAVKATSASAAPALQGTGKTVPPSAGVGAGQGAALDVHGRATFTRSGVLIIPQGASSALTALVPGGLLASSHVLATIQVNAGTVSIRAAVPFTAGTNKGKIQIFLTGAAPAVTGGFKVAWFVFG